MLHLVVALEAEARPLLERRGLKATGDGPWRVYQGDGVALVVSGVGKLAAAAATAYLAGLTAGGAAAGEGGRRPAAWLNLGLAGHPDAEVGDGLLAHKVTDRSSGQAWYPPLVFPPPGVTAEVVTVDRPERAYLEAVAYDMEAAGFFASASRLAPLELVHAYKVVSDNRARPVPERIAKGAVGELIAGRLGEIEGLVARLSGLAGELSGITAEPPGLDRFLAHCRFTATQRRRLRRLLARWAAAAGDAPAWDDVLADCRGASELLVALERRLNARPLVLGP